MNIKKIFIILLFTACADIGYAKVYWQKKSDGLVMQDAFAAKITSSNFSSNILLLGIDNSLYLSNDNADNWKQIKQFKYDEVIVDITSAQEQGISFIATSKSIYSIHEKTATIVNIFKIKGQENNIFSLFAAPPDSQKIFVGASNGIYYSDNSGKTWINFSNTQNFYVYKILLNNKGIFFVTNKGIMFSDNLLKSFNNIYSWNVSKQEYSDDIKEEEDDEGEINRRIIAFIEKKGKLYLITNKEFLFALDSKNFRNFNLTGLPDLDYVNDVEYWNALAACTKKGFYLYNKQDARWQMALNGIDSLNIFAANFSKDNDLFIVSDKGVYLKNYIDEKVLDFDDLSNIKQSFAFEPGINEVQEKTTQYAEVSKDKIDKWRRRVNSKAFLPKISAGYRESSDDTYEIYTASSSSYYLNGPEDYSRSWDFGASWDLGEFIWNDDQLAIDNRSKLMVQLREDMLDEVTRIYFERRREQINLLLDSRCDLNKKLEKMLRIDELTARIDAYTGGWFSKEIAVRKESFS